MGRGAFVGKKKKIEMGESKGKGIKERFEGLVNKEFKNRKGIGGHDQRIELITKLSHGATFLMESPLYAKFMDQFGSIH